MTEEPDPHIRRNFLPGRFVIAALASCSAALCSANPPRFCVPPQCAADQQPTEPSSGAAGGTVGPRRKCGLVEVPHEQLSDAWWTGPMLAASADTLPRGHGLIEPYLFDIRTDASDHFANLTYLLYGLSNRLSVGLITVGGFVVPHHSKATAPAIGDTTLLTQYRLVRFGEHGFPATVSLVLQDSLPTGAFDRLGSRAVAGVGSGAHSRQLALYLQTYLWLPNGRILRLRLDAGHTLPSRARPQGESVYGTPANFRGVARRGSADVIDTSFEYSLSKRLVIAWEMAWQHSGKTRVAGLVPTAVGTSVYVAALPGNDSVYLAPAVEYSWRPNLGVLIGLRLSPKGHDAPSSVTPALALNWVL